MKPPAETAVREPTEGRSSWNRPPTSTAPALRPREFGRWVWRQLTSMRTALILLFLLAVAAMPGSLIPQQRVDPSAVTAFQNRHPALTPLFDRIGMFNVYSSVWFSAIYLLLMISLLGCIMPRIRAYATAVRARPPRAPRNLSRLTAYETWLSNAPLATEVTRARELLKSQRRRIEVYETTDGTVVSAEKGYLREAGNLLFHCAVVVVLVGFAVTSIFGFKGSTAIVSGGGFSNTVPQYDQFTPGARFDAANLAPFSFAVRDFKVAYEPSGEGRGTPLYFNADLSVTDKPGDAPYNYDLRVNHPLQVDGTSVFLVGHGYAPDVTVRDGQGKVAFSGPVIFLPQDSSLTSFGVIKAPDAQPTQLGFEGYFFPTAATTPQGQPYSTFPDANNPLLVLTAYSGDLGLNTGLPQSIYVLDKTKLSPFKSPSGQARVLVLPVGQTIRLPGAAGSITFNGLKPWVQLQVSQQPGKVIPLVGVLAAIAGLLFSLFIRPRRTWVRVREADGHTVVEAAALDRVGGGDPTAHIAEVAFALRSEQLTEPPRPPVA